MKRIAILMLACAIRAQAQDFSESLLPTLKTYCIDCHNEKKHEGELNLALFDSETAVLSGRKVWKRVWEMLHNREMPPPEEEQPSEAQRLALTDWIEQVLARPVAGGTPDPGHVPPRRLTAVQYNATVADLFGVQRRTTFYNLDRNGGGMPRMVRFVLHRQFQEPLVHLPPDAATHGFDSLAESLSLPPFLMEKYLDAAQKLTAREDIQQAFLRRTGRQQRGGDSAETDRWIIADALKRAFRRPPDEQELARYTGFYDLAIKNGEDRTKAISVALQAILVAPQFLFRLESGVASEEKDSVRPLTDHELAARLSYFLWDTIPDRELNYAADEGRLRDPAVLAAQARRMLRDPRAEEFIRDFSLQWLRIQNISSHAPDPSVLGAFNNRLKNFNEALASEVLLLFATVMAEDRSVLDLVDPDFTWLNLTLCGVYGIENQLAPGVAKPNSAEWLRYPITDRRRGGVITAGATLMVNSNPTHTNPIKRGKWLLECVLGQTLPPPLPNVPNLDATPVVQGGLPIREKLARHSADATCASCHARIDPPGFALENYDAIGVWRDNEGGAAIDPAGMLKDGTKFNGPVGLKDMLRGPKRNEFTRCLTEHLFTYALGRPVQYYDIATIQGIVKKAEADGYRFSTLITEIITSHAFRYLKTKPDDS
ncbi:MAG: DUF1592 domain-containing protein [Verrucomicrobiaceae bacterium]|nr:DUF1592 domain-containing protein [Verrucomicrobiaceae bacterium]